MKIKGKIPKNKLQPCHNFIQCGAPHYCPFKVGLEKFNLMGYMWCIKHTHTHSFFHIIPWVELIMHSTQFPWLSTSTIQYNKYLCSFLSFWGIAKISIIKQRFNYIHHPLFPKTLKGLMNFRKIFLWKDLKSIGLTFSYPENLINQNDLSLEHPY